MRPATKVAATCLASILGMSSYMPGAILVTAIMGWLYNIPPTDFIYWVRFRVFGDLIFSSPSLCPSLWIRELCLAHHLTCACLSFNTIIMQLYSATVSYGPPEKAGNYTARFICIPLAMLMCSGLVYIGSCFVSQYIFIFAWKWGVLGRLAPGRQLSTQWDLMCYRVHLNLLRGFFWMIAERQFHSTFFFNPMLRALGSNVGTDAIVVGITGVLG